MDPFGIMAQLALFLLVAEHLACALAAAGGVTVKIVWEHEDVVLLVRKIGDKYRPKHEALYKVAQDRGVLGTSYLAIDRLHEELTNNLVERLIVLHYAFLNYTTVMRLCNCFYPYIDLCTR